jgi:uncharacterized protein (DUF433 family)
MPALDWSQCPAVESVPGRLGGAWVFRDTRMPISAVFENLEAGATIDEIEAWFDISKEQIIEVLKFAARSAAAPVPDETPEWLRKSWASAKEHGLDQLSMDEIDAEIDAARQHRSRSTAK